MNDVDRVQHDALVGAVESAWQHFQNLGLLNTFGKSGEEKLKLAQDYERARTEYDMAAAELHEFRKKLIGGDCV